MESKPLLSAILSVQSILLPNMKYAIFEFVDLGEMEVGETSWIADSDIESSLYSNSRFDFELDVVVNWPTRKGTRGTKPYGAKIVTFGDDKPELTSLLKRILDDNITDFPTLRQTLQQKTLGRGQREKKRTTESSDEDDEIQPPKKSSKAIKEARQNECTNILEQLKKQCQTAQQLSSGPSLSVDCEDCVDKEEVIAGLRREVDEQQREIKLLKASMAALTELPSVVAQLKASVREIQQQSTQSLPVPTLPSAPEPIVNSLNIEDTTDEISQERPRVTDLVISRCCRDNSQKFVNDLLTAMFDADYLASHSLSGSKSSKAAADSETKPSMDKADVYFIIAETQKHFPDRKDSDVRTAIRLKLNNVAKIVKRRTVMK